MDEKIEVLAKSMYDSHLASSMEEARQIANKVFGKGTPEQDLKKLDELQSDQDSREQEMKETIKDAKRDMNASEALADDIDHQTDAIQDDINTQVHDATVLDKDLENIDAMINDAKIILEKEKESERAEELIESKDDEDESPEANSEGWIDLTKKD